MNHKCHKCEKDYFVAECEIHCSLTGGILEIEGETVFDMEGFYMIDSELSNLQHLHCQNCGTEIKEMINISQKQQIKEITGEDAGKLLEALIEHLDMGGAWGDHKAINNSPYMRCQECKSVNYKQDDSIIYGFFGGHLLNGDRKSFNPEEVYKLNKNSCTKNAICNNCHKDTGKIYKIGKLRPVNIHSRMTTVGP